MPLVDQQPDDVLPVLAQRHLYASARQRTVEYLRSKPIATRLECEAKQSEPETVRDYIAVNSFDAIQNDNCCRCMCHMIQLISFYRQSMQGILSG
jgi:hypothetical protein